MAGLAARLTQGLDLFGHRTSGPKWVGVVAADRPWSDTREWYARAGIPDIPHWSLIDSSITVATLRKQDAAINLLKTIVEELSVPAGGILILDPVSLWCGGDMNRYMAVYLALIELNRFCIRQRVTVLGLAHTGKQKADASERYARPQDRINGSAALLGCSGTQMALETPDQTDSSQYRFSWTPHHAPSESFWLTRDPDTGLFVQGENEDAVSIPHPELLHCLPGLDEEPLKTRECLRRIALAKHEPPSQAVFYRYLSQWQAAGVVIKIDQRYRRTQPIRLS